MTAPSSAHGTVRPGPGRPPRAGTAALRTRLEEDLRTGQVAAPLEYLEWMMERDPAIDRATARQIVYRERRRVLEEAGVDDGPRGHGGAQPRSSTLALRTRLEQDARDGALRPAQDYVRWLLGQDREVGLRMARQAVYRELRRLRYTGAGRATGA